METNQNNRNDQAEIFGQKFPLNKWFFLTIFTVIMAFLALKLAGHDPIQEYFVAGLYNAEGKSIKTDNTKIFRFWTPDTSTWNSMSPMTQDEIVSKKQDQWYKTTNKNIDDFSKALMSNSLGYSRWEAWGQGTNEFKKGLLWSLTVPADSEFSVKSLAKLYANYFKRDKNIYIETINLYTMQREQ